MFSKMSIQQIELRMMDLLDQDVVPALHFMGNHWIKILSSGVAIYLTWKWCGWMLQKRKILAIIAKKSDEFKKKKDGMKNKLIASGSGKLISEERSVILSYSILELTTKLRNGDLDPVAVLEAYQAQALVATEKTNCVVEFLDESLEIAKELKSVPIEKRGPLFGLPISVKECYWVKGYPHTSGLCKWIDRVAEHDGQLIQMMKRMGAIPFCLTNIPQTMWSYGCSNPVFGATTHPKDKLRTPGGSSGGEACLLAQGGSILGLGSDVGGSLRIPAAFCGITSLKPTLGRICESGRDKGVVPGVTSNAGFMCRSVEGVILGMKTLLQNPELMSDIDHSVIPVPWREEMTLSKKLKIGWFDDDGYFPAVPGCKRAVQVAVDLLKSRGHEIVHFLPPGLYEVHRDFYRFMLGDAGKTHLEKWKGEILDQSIEMNNIVYQCPLFLRRTLMTWLVTKLTPTMGNLGKCGYTFTGDLWQGLIESDVRKTQILNEWRDAEIDVIIAPGFTFPAPRLKDPARLLPAINFTGVYNVLNFPVGSVPVDIYTKEDEANMVHYPKGDILFDIVRNSTKGAEGLPLNVQVVGRPWQEELILQVMRQIEEVAHFQKKYSYE